MRKLGCSKARANLKKRQLTLEALADEPGCLCFCYGRKHVLEVSECALEYSKYALKRSYYNIYTKREINFKNKLNYNLKRKRSGMINALHRSRITKLPETKVNLQEFSRYKFSRYFDSFFYFIPFFVKIFQTFLIKRTNYRYRERVTFLF
ncbi:hypothetical protein BDF21DRAFT_400323 [Thamnidium elegans]|nr:hypothetical protein BDF21DRAFT_400323 [Thamnidium elegans]